MIDKEQNLESATDKGCQFDAIVRREIPEWLDNIFEELSFTRIICNWADALWSDSESNVSVECVIIECDGKLFFRLFSSIDGIQDGGYAMYLHTFVKNIDEVKTFIKILRLRDDAA